MLQGNDAPPKTLKDYLISINAATITGELFSGQEGQFKTVHGGHTNPKGKTYEVLTMNCSDPYWSAWAQSRDGTESVKVQWAKEKDSAPPTGEDIIAALKKAAGV